MAEQSTPAFDDFMRAALAGNSDRLDILEVGGGPQTFVKHPQARYTVLEHSAEALATSTYADHRLIGDAQTFDYGAHRFGVVVFWNVLEHIQDPILAVKNACGCLNPNGLLVIRGPELRSLKSMIARATPHRVHVAFYRKVLNHPHAGRKGHAPFLIEHSTGAGSVELDAALAAMGFEVFFAEDYVGDQERLFEAYSPVAYGAYRAVAWMIRRLTGARWATPHTDFVRVYRFATHGR